MKQNWCFERVAVRSVATSEPMPFAHSNEAIRWSWTENFYRQSLVSSSLFDPLPDLSAHRTHSLLSEWSTLDSWSKSSHLVFDCCRNQWCWTVFLRDCHSSQAQAKRMLASYPLFYWLTSAKDWYCFDVRISVCFQVIESFEITTASDILIDSVFLQMVSRLCPQGQRRITFDPTLDAQGCRKDSLLPRIYWWTGECLFRFFQMERLI